MAYTLESTRTEDVGPRKAEELLRTNTFEGQRTKDPKWIQHLATEINQGSFTKGNIALAKNCKSDALTLMNGQHQLEACLLSGKVIKVTTDIYKYETADDLWHLFAKFDVGKQRSDRQIIKAARGLFKNEDLRAIPLGVLASCGTALVWLGGGTKPVFTAKAISKTTKGDLAQKYASDVIWVSEIVRNYQSVKGRAKSCPPVPVVTAMIATHRVNAEKSDEFWEKVLGGHDLKRSSPQWRLHGAISTGLSKGSTYCSGSRYWKGYALCVSWWNSFITNDGRTSVKVEAMKSLPDVLG